MTGERLIEFAVLVLKIGDVEKATNYIVICA